uniref:Histone RNA hairpin-binding protein RNA-binding domain-containing protein n=1 Tax=Chromera velia CCMP2878 TaxID=1169474 RepID=A0A0G4FSD6_9ALVE|mmetsp:Transcript_21686/g.43117  ORF Transcript_21686/g.43117 Transcript_21686/m.43117 type:complete len:531 (+) Transcript_21686:38-1630(+)|eukprot:Cvel_3686.t1-p1 / transcript=Cvel_3686.t1 / gene=Cvel_3686 / organism=Chromera_velia_CCMP2878 / gene_product=hypothetical protein / transcript_product=hypothetical protein / location=Cvel_scaffold153:39809-42647(+) / protein_length=530 / sequence_SO=supercontig / SO=protein_coding / is_pseudo=false
MVSKGVGHPSGKGSGGEAKGGQTVVKDAQHRMMQRRKQIDIGKSSKSYQRYLSKVPKEKRVARWARAQHPWTPDFRADLSVRDFVARVKEWRRLLHKFHDDSPDHQVCFQGAPQDPSEGCVGTGKEMSLSSLVPPFPSASLSDEASISTAGTGGGPSASSSSSGGFNGEGGSPLPSEATEISAVSSSGMDRRVTGRKPRPFVGTTRLAPPLPFRRPPSLLPSPDSVAATLAFAHSRADPKERWGVHKPVAAHTLTHLPSSSSMFPVTPSVEAIREIRRETEVGIWGQSREGNRRAEGGPLVSVSAGPTAKAPTMFFPTGYRTSIDRDRNKYLVVVQKDLDSASAQWKSVEAMRDCGGKRGEEGEDTDMCDKRDEEGDGRDKGGVPSSQQPMQQGQETEWAFCHLPPETLHKARRGDVRAALSLVGLHVQSLGRALKKALGRQGARALKGHAKLQRMRAVVAEREKQHRLLTETALSQDQASSSIQPAQRQEGRLAVNCVWPRAAPLRAARVMQLLSAMAVADLPLFRPSE